MTRKRRVTNHASIRVLSCDGCPAVVPLMEGEKTLPEWKTMDGSTPPGQANPLRRQPDEAWRMIRDRRNPRHLCPRCWRQSREGAA